MKKEVLTGIKLFLIMTFVLGIIYPVITIIIAQAVFPEKASGSIIVQNGTEIGSILIGQNFTSDRYFASRPSAINYDPSPSGASNLSQTSRILKTLYEDREQNFAERYNLASSAEIPQEMLFASGSGVDPHITPQSALLQADKICRVRGFNDSEKERLVMKIHELTEAPQIGFLGKSVINVLLLNIELDKIKR